MRLSSMGRRLCTNVLFFRNEYFMVYVQFVNANEHVYILSKKGKLSSLKSHFKIKSRVCSVHMFLCVFVP